MRGNIVRIGILTISDRSARGEREDASGPLIAEIVHRDLEATIATRQVVPDEQNTISATLIAWSDSGHIDLILTTGGTGFSPRDVTPEATRAIIDREAPGLAEAMRAASLSKTPHAMLSRGVCGIRGRTLIVNLPGSPKAIRENMDVIVPVLPHAISLLTSRPDAEQGHTIPS
jgi:molybdopterin adenylyltransferase